MLFLRDTKNPHGDLIRGWSGHATAWFNTEEKARDEQIRRGTGTVLQDPVSGAWNPDPEVGLSGFGFDDWNSFVSAMRCMESYAHDEVRGIGVFESHDFDMGAGADGEDCFRNARYLGHIPLDAIWENIETLVYGQALPAL